MKVSQPTRSEKRRAMFIENKDGDIDGAGARVDWVEFSKSGLSLYYRGAQRSKKARVKFDCSKRATLVVGDAAYIDRYFSIALRNNVRKATTAQK